MVRETRHLLIGNLPSNLNEERILDHFKKYGKVQSVKLLSRENSSFNDYSATIAFNDIKACIKAHNAENKIEERILKTNYYEPPANSTSSTIYIHESRGDSLNDCNSNQGSCPTTGSLNNQNVQNQTSSNQQIRSSVVSSRHLMTNSNRLKMYDRTESSESLDEFDDKKISPNKMAIQTDNKVTDYKTTGFSTTNLNKKDSQVDNAIYDLINKSIDINENQNNNQLFKTGQKLNCGICNQPVYDENPMKFNNKSYHRFCYKCSSCNAQLDNSVNPAYRCEVEKRFYCIRCCDCKCWLTNSDKITKSEQKDTKIPELINQVKSVAKDGKRCEFCKQLMPNDLQITQNNLGELKKLESDKQTELNENLADKKLDLVRQEPDLIKKEINEQINEIPKAPPLPLINNLSLVYKSSKQFNLAKQIKEQKLKNFDQQIKKANFNRNAVFGQEQEGKKIKLIKKPTIGRRIARIIDKLENSLNQKTERKFEETFYQNLAENLEQNSDENLEENLKKKLNSKEFLFKELQSRLKQKEGNLDNFKINPNKLNDRIELDQKFDKEIEENLDNGEQVNERRTKERQKNLILKENEILNKRLIYCPNCKIQLSLNLFLKKGICRPFCSTHCREETKVLDDQKNSPPKSHQLTKSVYVTDLEKVQKSGKKDESLNYKINDKNEIKSKPFNLLLNKVDHFQPHSPPYSKKYSPVKNLKTKNMQNISKFNYPSEYRETKQINKLNNENLKKSIKPVSCKCSLKSYRANEKVNLESPNCSECLKCSLCGCSL